MVPLSASARRLSTTPLAGTGAPGHRARQHAVFVVEQLGGFQPLHFGRERFLAEHFQYRKPPAAEIQRGNPVARAVAVHGGEQVFAFLHLDGRHAADFLRSEVHLLLVDELAGREHGRLDAARHELLEVYFDDGAAPEP